MKTKLGILGLVTSAAIVAHGLPYSLVRISGESMSPTFHNGQFLVAERTDGHVVRGDVVVFRKDGATMVKRVLFTEGDRVLLFNSQGSWNGAVSDHAANVLRKLRYETKEVVVPPGHVFVVGDNMMLSSDSRVYGTIPVSSIQFELPAPPSDTSTLFAGSTLNQRTAYQPMETTQI